MHEDALTIESEVELAPRTSLGVGGRAAHFVRVENEAQLTAALAWAGARSHRVRVLGGGTNLVVADAGCTGLVIEVALRGIEITELGSEVKVRARAGEPWDEFVAAMVRCDYQGLECLSGIPGRVGATPIQNVGAYGQEVGETIEQVVTIDRKNGQRRIFTREECAFAYRDSVFRAREQGRFVVTEVCFALHLRTPPALRYAELEGFFRTRGHGTPSLNEVRKAVIQLRREKSMVIDEADPNTRSCGSFFVNPVLSAPEFSRFSARIGPEKAPPSFAQAGGTIKLSAAWLIEQAGLARGTRDGPVGLSTKHALALIAYDGARAEHVRQFAERVRRAVLDQFGIVLRPEPIFWGFADDDQYSFRERAAR
jgi:UDP-N-acetylmuramate dehydrogenase